MSYEASAALPDGADQALRPLLPKPSLTSASSSDTTLSGQHDILIPSYRPVAERGRVVAACLQCRKAKQKVCANIGIPVQDGLTRLTNHKQCDSARPKCGRCRYKETDICQYESHKLQRLDEYEDQIKNLQAEVERLRNLAPGTRPSGLAISKEHTRDTQDAQGAQDATTTASSPARPRLAERSSSDADSMGSEAHPTESMAKLSERGHKRKLGSMTKQEEVLEADQRQTPDMATMVDEYFQATGFNGGLATEGEEYKVDLSNVRVQVHDDSWRQGTWHDAIKVSETFTAAKAEVCSCPLEMSLEQRLITYSARGQLRWIFLLCT